MPTNKENYAQNFGKKTKTISVKCFRICQGSKWNSNLLNDNKIAFKLFNPSLDPCNVAP